MRDVYTSEARGSYFKTQTIRKLCFGQTLMHLIIAIVYKSFISYIESIKVMNICLEGIHHKKYVLTKQVFNTNNNCWMFF